MNKKLMGSLDFLHPTPSRFQYQTFSLASSTYKVRYLEKGRGIYVYIYIWEFNKYEGLSTPTRSEVIS